MIMQQKKQNTNEQNRMKYSLMHKDKSWFVKELKIDIIILSKFNISENVNWKDLISELRTRIIQNYSLLHKEEWIKNNSPINTSINPGELKKKTMLG